MRPAAAKEVEPSDAAVITKLCTLIRFGIYVRIKVFVIIDFIGGGRVT